MTANRVQGTPHPTAQTKAARALRDITQSEIADAANLRLSTIVVFERDDAISSFAIQAIRDLMGAVIAFINQNGDGPRIRPRKRISKSQQQIEPFKFAFTRLSEI